MDISTPLIFITLFLLAFISLFIVYKYGIKEKSYEEALAEQRQTTNALLGVKPKPKEKKSKKAAKKLKEKSSPPEIETDESENVDTSNTVASVKAHVEFKEELEEVPEEAVQIKLKRVKKVRPILVKKDKSSEKVALDVVEAPIVNHFEENPPKDDFELLRSNSELVKEKVVKEKKQTLDGSPPNKSNKKPLKQQVTSNVSEPVPVVEKEIVETLVESVTVELQTNGIMGNPGKEKKKKKSEFNTRQQLSAERDGLIKLVRKAEFSKSEVQLLIDLLLNKQLEAPEVINDWSEGKSNPVQKLKKQLAEKEKALAEEQEALLGAQAKLKEIRSEQQAEKAQLQQKIRGLEDVIQNKSIEHQATNNRLQGNTQKIQQMQADLNAEILKTHKFGEENAALQMQIQQMQEADNIIATLRNEVEEFSAQNQHLRLELQQIIAEKDHHQQQVMIQMNLEKGLKQQIQQLEESCQDLERNLEIALRQESDVKMEISNLDVTLHQQFEEKRRLEYIIDQLKEEIQVLNNENGDNIKVVTQLKSELQQIKEEQTAQVNGSSEENKAQEVEILNLSDELSSVRNELSSIKTELQQTETKYKTELECSEKKYSIIQTELEEQKQKNNELRTKNWKVMEALNVAESRSKENKLTDLNLDQITNEIRAKELASQKQFIQRLFPEIEDLRAVTSEDWQAEFGKLIINYVSDLKKHQISLNSSPEASPEIAKLQAQVQHYSDVIDDTAGTLKRFQSHVEKEEIKWRHELQAKITEIEVLKESCVLPLKEKVLSLEKQLFEETKLKEQIKEECYLLKSHKSQQTDATATVEKLSEEVNRLREQLRVEQTKNGDANVCLKAQSNCNNSNSTNGSAPVEHCLSSSSSLASSVIEEYNKKPKNKKKKKKGTGNQV